MSISPEFGATAETLTPSATAEAKEEDEQVDLSKLRRRSPLREAISREEWEQPWMPDVEDMPRTAGEPEVPLHIQIEREMDVAARAEARTKGGEKKKLDPLNVDPSKSRRRWTEKDRQLDRDMKGLITQLVGGVTPEHVAKLKEEPGYATFDPQQFVSKLFTNELQLKDPVAKRTSPLQYELLPNEAYMATQHVDPKPVAWDPVQLLDLKHKYDTGKLTDEEVSSVIFDALSRGLVTQEQLQEYELLNKPSGQEGELGISSLFPNYLDSDEEDAARPDAEVEAIENEAQAQTRQLVQPEYDDEDDDEEEDDDDEQDNQGPTGSASWLRHQQKQPLRKKLTSNRMRATARAKENAAKLGVGRLGEAEYLSDGEGSSDDDEDNGELARGLASIREEQFDFHLLSDDDIDEEREGELLESLEHGDPESLEFLERVDTLDPNAQLSEDEDQAADIEEAARAMGRQRRMTELLDTFDPEAEAESEDDSAVYDDTQVGSETRFKFSETDPYGTSRQALRRTAAVVANMSPSDRLFVTTESFETLISDDEDDGSAKSFDTVYDEENPYKHEKLGRGLMLEQVENGEVMDLREAVLDVDVDQAKLYAESIDDEGNDGPLVAYSESMQMATGGRRPILKDATKEELYDLHLSDPDRWTVAALSQKYGLRQARVRTIIIHKRREKEVERVRPELLTPDLQEAMENETGAVADFHDPELADAEVVTLNDAAPHGPTFTFVDGAVDRKKAAAAYWRGTKKLRRNWVPPEQIPRVPTPNTPPAEMLDPGLISGFAPPKRRVIYANWNPDVHPLEEFVVVREPDGSMRTPSFEERVRWLFMPLFNMLPESYRRPENASRIDAPVDGPEWDGTPGDYIGPRKDYHETLGTLKAYSDLSKEHGLYLDEAIQQLVDGNDSDLRRRQTELASEALHEGDVPTDSWRNFATEKPDGSYEIDEETQEFLEQMHKKQTLEELQAEHDSLDSVTSADGFFADDLIAEADLMHGIKNKGFINWDQHFKGKIKDDPLQNLPPNHRDGPPLPFWLTKNKQN